MKEFKNLKAILEDLEIKFEILCLFSVMQNQILGDFHKNRVRLEKDFKNFLVLKEDCLKSLSSLKRVFSQEE